MDIKDFIEKFAESIEAEDTVITAETKFRDLDDWNSLAGLSVIAMFDEEFGKELSVQAFKAATTIEDLFKLAQ